jgi:hypothetical protein
MTAWAWTITGVRTRTIGELTDVLVEASFRLAGVDDNIEEETTQTVALLPPGENFIPYPEVTESDVVGWVQAALDAKSATRVELLQAELQDRIERRRSPAPAAKPLPWAEAA